jgi:SAM-dependent methyltransferase
MGATALASQLAGLGVPFEMLCIDLSDASLEIAREGLEREGLSKYLTFQRRPIEDLETEPAGRFDYVDLSGVINHVEDPVRVAAALHRVLADPGGIGVMAYGALGRTGIYPVQDMLRQLGLATKESVPEARALLLGLPDSNWLKRNPILADSDSISDAEFADRYLNPRDRAFSVRDLEELFGGAGLDLKAFLPPIVYDAKAMLSSEENRRRADRLTNVEKWHLAEQMQGSLHNHSFLAVKASDPAGSVVDFGDPDYRAVIRGANRAHLVEELSSRVGQRVSIEFSYDSRTRTMGLKLSDLEIKVLRELVEGVNFGGVRARLAEDDAAKVSAAIERVCTAFLSVGALYLEVPPDYS